MEFPSALLAKAHWKLDLKFPRSGKWNLYQDLKFSGILKTLWHFRQDFRTWVFNLQHIFNLRTERDTSTQISLELWKNRLPAILWNGTKSGVVLYSSLRSCVLEIRKISILKSRILLIGLLFLSPGFSIHREFMMDTHFSRNCFWASFSILLVWEIENSAFTTTLISTVNIDVEWHWLCLEVRRWTATRTKHKSHPHRSHSILTLPISVGE